MADVTVDRYRAGVFQSTTNYIGVTPPIQHNYTFDPADVGFEVTFTATITDGGLTTTRQWSAGVIGAQTTGLVFSTPATVTGASAVGSLLTGSYVVTNNNGTVNYVYSWQRNGVTIAGATGITYTSVVADVDQAITFTVQATDDDGSKESVSNPLTVTYGTLSFSTGPVITGTPNVGNVLTASATATGGTGPYVYSYRWYRDDIVIENAVNPTYTLTEFDYPAQITVRVKAVDDNGASVSDISPAVATGYAAPTAGGALANQNIVLESATTTYSTAFDFTGEDLHYTVNTVQGVTVDWFTGVVTFDSWNMPSQTGTTVTITATNPAGGFITSSFLLNSELQAPSLGANVPTITGTTVVGQTLTAVEASYTGSSASVTWQWNRDGSPIGGATAQTYVLVGADEGTLITVTQTVTNTGGSDNATSASVGPITAASTTPVLSSLNVQDYVGDGSVSVTLPSRVYVRLDPVSTNPDAASIISGAGALYHTYVDTTVGGFIGFSVTLPSNVDATYQVSLVARIEPDGTPSNVVTDNAFLIDTLAPVLSTPTGAQTGDYTASGSVVSDEGNGTLYAAVVASTETTTVSALVAASVGAYIIGTGASAGTNNFNATGLNPGTAYRWAFGQVDARGNQSAVVYSSPFTTTETNTGTPVETATYYRVLLFTGTQERFTVPAGVTELQFAIAGGGGGPNYQSDGTTYSGAGAYVSGTLPVVENDVIVVEVADSGWAGTELEGGYGGWPDGGDGGADVGESGGGGGGSTRVWKNGVLQMIAAGGGGDGNNTGGGYGGADNGQRGGSIAGGSEVVPAITPLVVANSTFETGDKTGWTLGSGYDVVTTNPTPYSGTYCLKSNATTRTPTIYQDVAIPSTHWATIDSGLASIEAKCRVLTSDNDPNDGYHGPAIGINILFLNENGAALADVDDEYTVGAEARWSTSGSWVEYTAGAQLAPSGARTVRITLFGFVGASSETWTANYLAVDNVSVDVVEGTRLDAGLLNKNAESTTLSWSLSNMYVYDRYPDVDTSTSGGTTWGSGSGTGTGWSTGGSGTSSTGVPSDYYTDRYRFKFSGLFLVDYGYMTQTRPLSAENQTRADNGTLYANFRVLFEGGISANRYQLIMTFLAADGSTISTYTTPFVPSIGLCVQATPLVQVPVLTRSISYTFRGYRGTADSINQQTGTVQFLNAHLFDVATNITTTVSAQEGGYGGTQSTFGVGYGVDGNGTGTIDLIGTNTGGSGNRTTIQEDAGGGGGGGYYGGGHGQAGGGGGSSWAQPALSFQKFQSAGSGAAPTQAVSNSRYSTVFDAITGLNGSVGVTGSAVEGGKGWAVMTWEGAQMSNAPADSLWADVVLYSSLDSYDGQTYRLRDKSLSRHYMTLENGASLSSTVTPAFGNTALHTAGGVLRVPYSPDFYFMENATTRIPFCVESFLYADDFTPAIQTIWSSYNAAANKRGIQLILERGTSPNHKLVLQISTTGFDVVRAVEATVTEAQLNGGFKHVGVDFDGTDYRIVYDGTVLATSTAAYNIAHSGQDFCIGLSSGGLNPFYGRQHAFRVTRGSRYTTSYTPVTTAFGEGINFADGDVVDGETPTSFHLDQVTGYSDTSASLDVFDPMKGFSWGPVYDTYPEVEFVADVFVTEIPVGSPMIEFTSPILITEIPNGSPMIEFVAPIFILEVV